MSETRSTININKRRTLKKGKRKRKKKKDRKESRRKSLQNYSLLLAVTIDVPR